jgi:hypothetical protein
MARPKKTIPVVPKDLKVYKETKQQLSIYDRLKQFFNQFNK